MLLPYVWQNGKVACLSEEPYDMGLSIEDRAELHDIYARYAYAFEASGDRRKAPPRTPELPAGT